MTDDEFRELYAALGPVVLRYAARRVGDQRAQDVVAETFAVVWEKRDSFPGDRDAWTAWTIGVARNKVLQDVQARRRKHHDHRFTSDWLDEGAEPSIADTAGTVVDSVEGHRVYAGLTPAERDLFGIAFLHDLTPTDGAALLDLTVTAYTSRVARLRQRLRELAAEGSGAGS